MANVRRVLPALVGRAVDIVNEIDGDGSPSLASPAVRESQICWSAGADDDREICCPTATKLVSDGKGQRPFRDPTRHLCVRSITAPSASMATVGVVQQRNTLT